MDKYPVNIINEAVQHFENLPGIGKRTALRMVLYLLKQDKSVVKQFGDTLLSLLDKVKFCSRCNNFSNFDVCEICSDHKRDATSVCLVENIQDVIAIESTNHFHGLYHVLGGVISPMDGIGPSDLNIDTLVNRIKNENIKEVIFALSTTMEGDTTAFYIFKKIMEFNLKISTIARGVSVGGELEYADEVTLGRAILKRVPYEQSI